VTTTERDGQRSDHAPVRRRRVAGGSVVLWGGTVAIGMSTAVLLAILSRHHSVNFAALSAILGLSFVISLIPSGVQLRAATLAADGFALPRFSPRFLGTLAVGGVAISPVLALVLKVPVLAVIFIVAQLVAALPLAVQRGALIGVHRFGALGSNMGLESGIRMVVGAIAGLTLGIAGLAGALALATATALLVLPRRPLDTDGVERPQTSLFNVSVTLVLLGLFVQMDVLLAPSGLTPRAAKLYDLAATPSKGVYIALLAIGSIIFPFVRLNASRRLIVKAAAGTLVLGLVVTGVLLALRHVIGIVLDQPAPSFLLLALLGSAMAVAGTTSVFINAGVARGVARPWPPPAMGMAVMIVCWALRPTATTFAVTFLLAQCGALAISSWVTLMGRRGAPTNATLVESEALLAPVSVWNGPPCVGELVHTLSPHYSTPRPGRFSTLGRSAVQPRSRNGTADGTGRDGPSARQLVAEMSPFYADQMAGRTPVSGGRPSRFGR
jgi:hypothetical protein